MNRLLFASALLLAVSSAASAAPAPLKAVTSPAHSDLLSSVRSHVAALSRQPLASPGVAVQGVQAVPPAFASLHPGPLRVIAAASMNGGR